MDKSQKATSKQAHSYDFLVDTDEYSRATLLTRQLKEANIPFKIELIVQEDKSKTYEIHVPTPETKRAQTLLFGEEYEPDFEGKYAALGQKKDMLRRKSLTAFIAIITGAVLQFAEQGNGDFTLFALICYGIGLWSLSGAYKAVKGLIVVKKEFKS